MRYPLVEAGTGVMFALVYLRVGPSVEVVAYLYLAAIGIALLLIDLDVKRLPNVIVLPAYLVLPVLLAVASAVDGDWSAMLRAAMGGMLLYAFYFGAMVAYPGGMGFGDVKLAGVLGIGLAWMGWGALVVGAFGAFLLGGIFSIGLVLSKRAHRKTGIPFGPWMLAGAAIGIGWGEGIWGAYLSLMQ